MIRAYISEEQRDWDLYLGCLAGAYRATPHEVTGMTPNLLMLGREVRFPTEVLVSRDEVVNDEVKSYGAYVASLRTRMQHAYKVARKYLSNKAVKQKQFYDGKTALNKFKAGDYVWYLLESRKIGE